MPRLWSRLQAALPRLWSRLRAASSSFLAQAVVQAGDAVVVRGAASGERLPAKVRSIETFPQEIGFLRSNNALPNAREKAYSVRARFLEAPRSMRAGVEVTVELAGEEWSGP